MTSDHTDLFIKLFSTPFWGRVEYTRYRDLPKGRISQSPQNQLKTLHITQLRSHYLSPCRFYFPASTHTGLPSTRAGRRRQISPSWAAKALMALPHGGDGPGAAAPRGARGGRCSRRPPPRSPAPLRALSLPLRARPPPSTAPHTPASAGYTRAPARGPKMVPQTSPRRRRPSPGCRPAAEAARPVRAPGRPALSPAAGPPHAPPHAPPRRCPGAGRGGRARRPRSGGPRPPPSPEGRPRPRPGEAHPRRPPAPLPRLGAARPGRRTPPRPGSPQAAPSIQLHPACHREGLWNSNSAASRYHNSFWCLQTDRSDHLP